MEIAFLFILPAALWTHSWHLMGHYSNDRALGVVGAGVAIALLGLVMTWQGSVIIKGSEAPLAALILAWAVYGALLAAVGIWGFDQRTLGHYGLFLALVSVIFVVYYFLGDAILLDSTEESPTKFPGQGISTISYIMGAYAAILAAVGGLLFLHLAIPMRSIQGLVGRLFLVGAVASVVLGALVILGLSLPSFDQL